VAPPTLGAVTTTATHSLLDGLNPQQRAAVTHAGGPLLIVAGAGSGKTRVLTHRIAYLLAERGVAPGEILAITFTNKAAGEMAARVASLVGDRRARAMWVMTFHSACVRILRREATRFGYPSNFSIYDSADSQRLMALVCRELELDARQYPPKGMAAQVSNLKNELIDYESFAANARGAREKALAEAYAEYQRRLVAAGAMDFDDLIMVTVNLFQAFPEVSEAYRRRFRHVLGLGHIERAGKAGLDVAEGAGPRAGVAHDHEGRVLLVPALADIGATRLLAHGHEVVLADDVAGVGITARVRRADPNPVRLGRRQRVRPVHLFGVPGAQRRG